MDNKVIEEGLNAWMAFLSFDEPDRIVELITHFPKFKPLYQDIYKLCLNTERMIGMYSKELQMLDENTVKFMMDEMQAENDVLRAANDELQSANDELQSVIDKLQSERDELLRRLESPDFSRKDAHL